MTEKIGSIKNPLTVIAIFAGIAEVSGTVVLPFVAAVNQELFIWFLISFPSLLVIIFFITLNFNNKVLYAPSDYKDEANYIKINKFDESKQRRVEIIVPAKNQNIEVETIEITSQNTNERVVNTENIHPIEETSKNDEPYTVPTPLRYSDFRIKVSSFKNAEAFIKFMRDRGFNVTKYHAPAGRDETPFSKFEAIWLGPNIPLDVAKLGIASAKEFYPHLKYLRVTEPSVRSGKQLYIGGASESAVINFRLRPLSESDFEALQLFSDLEQMHDFIKEFAP